MILEYVTVVVGEEFCSFRKIAVMMLSGRRNTSCKFLILLQLNFPVSTMKIHEIQVGNCPKKIRCRKGRGINC
jgi:hypothetical protein